MNRRTLLWKGKGINEKIFICDEKGTLVGEIGSFKDRIISRIAQKKFVIRSEGFLKLNKYIVDPDDEKAYFEVVTKTNWLLITKMYLLTPTNKFLFKSYSKNYSEIRENEQTLVSFENDNVFGYTSGRIIITENMQNWEMLVFGLLLCVRLKEEERSAL